MSKSNNLSGNTLVVDRVIELGGSSLSVDALGVSMKLDKAEKTDAQIEFARRYSVIIEGNRNPTIYEDAVLYASIICDGARLPYSSSAVASSRITWKYGDTEVSGLISENNTITVSLEDLKQSPTTLIVTWNSNEVSSVPLYATTTLSAGEITQYTYSEIDNENLLDSDDSIEWFQTTEEALESVETAELQYVWMRVSSTYSFEQKCYYNFKYYKKSLWYEGLNPDATASDVINAVSPKKSINFLYSASNFITNRRSSGNNPPITFEIVTEGYNDVEVVLDENGEGWHVTGFDIAESEKQAMKISFEVPYNNDFSNIVVSVTVRCDGTNYPWVYDMKPVDITGSWATLGKFSEDPIDSDFIITEGLFKGNRVIDGDVYIKYSVDSDGVEHTYPMVFLTNKFVSLSTTKSMAEYNERLLSTLDEVFSYADSDSNHETTQDYDMFKNIVAKNVTAETIGAKKIKVLNNGCIYGGGFSEDGTLPDANKNVSGFHISSDGTLQANYGTFNNITIKEESKLLGTIDSTVLSTNLNPANASTVYTANTTSKNPVTCTWKDIKNYAKKRIIEDFHSNLGLSYYQTHRVGGSFNKDFSADGLAYITTIPSDSVHADYRITKHASDFEVYTHNTLFVVEQLEISGTTSANSNFVWDWHTPSVKLYINDTCIVLAERRTGNYGMNGSLSKQRISFGGTFFVPVDSDVSIVVEAHKYSLNHSDGSLKVIRRHSHFRLGFNVFRKNDTKNYTIDDWISDEGICDALPNATIINSSTYIIPRFDLTKKTEYPSGVNPLYHFSWNRIVVDSGTASQFFTTPKFEYTDENGVKHTTTVNYLNWNDSSVTANGNTTISSSGYYRDFSVSFQLVDAPEGVYLANTYVKKKGTTPCIGTSDDPFGEIYGQHIEISSARKLKENISPFDDSAIDIINKTDVVTFNYKTDARKQYHVGFIADDTDSRISGEEHNRMDLGNCIGVLLKAVQELNEKIERLKEAYTR